MVLAESILISQPQRKKKCLTIDPENLIITSYGIFVKGEINPDRSRVYEDKCAGKLPEKYPDKFIISPPAIDKMSLIKNSPFSGSRPDALILESQDDQTYLWGMEEYKSSRRKDGEYQLPQKARGLLELKRKIEGDPLSLRRCLRIILEDAYSLIDFNLDTILVPKIVYVNFITDDVAKPIDSTYPGMEFHYDVIEAPPIYPRFPFSGLVFQPQSAA